MLYVSVELPSKTSLVKCKQLLKNVMSMTTSLWSVEATAAARGMPTCRSWEITLQCWYSRPKPSVHGLPSAVSHPGVTLTMPLKMLRAWMFAWKCCARKWRLISPASMMHSICEITLWTMVIYVRIMFTSHSGQPSAWSNVLGSGCWLEEQVSAGTQHTSSHWQDKPRETNKGTKSREVQGTRQKVCDIQSLIHNHIWSPNQPNQH